MPARFEIVARRRPLALVQPGTTLPGAPYVAVERDVAGPGHAALRSGDTTLTASWDGERVAIEVGHAHRSTRHVSRRHGRAPGTTSVALSLTGRLLVAWSRAGDGPWIARARRELDDVPVHDAAWLGALTADGDRSGTFGQLGLRDLRTISGTDLLTATSAGPGGFSSGHTSVWELDRGTLDLTHRADLFVRRDGGVYGDHASHLLRDGPDWLWATSTWGDFDRRAHPHVGAVVARTATDLTRGTHVLDAAPLPLPTTGLRSVGVWDPHLARTDDGGWLAAYVSATRFFRFHPVVAQGPDLDRLALRAAASERGATEGPTLHRGHDGGWQVLASDGRDGRRGRRAGYPVFDLDLAETGRLDAAYPTNLPWPTLVPDAGGWLMVGFNGARAGGDLLGYGTHGQVVIQRAPG